MSEPFVGQIVTFGFGWAPIGYLPCDGRLMPISDNQVLYAVLGTTYGGDGVQTFALPNLNGRIPVGQGQGRGLQNYVVGQPFGSEEITLLTTNMPTHNHTVSFTNLPGVSESPKPISGAPVAMGTNVGSGVPPFYVSGGTGTVALNGGTVTPSGGSQPHENRQPYVALNYAIAIAGIFPSQS
jgi:microcystin-dependent protein